MCGIALLHNVNVSNSMSTVLKKLSHRGPDDSYIWSSNNLEVGFVRLAINDESISGRQPYQFKHIICAINGEIYNSGELAKQYGIAMDSSCDTYVIAPLFAEIGAKILDKLDGFYSGIIYEKNHNSLYLLRDYIGKKPLFYGLADNQLFVVSELKAIDNIEWFKQVPLGLSQLNLTSGHLEHIANHQYKNSCLLNLSTTLKNAVLKRLPKQKFGVFLSGGLDSSIISSLVNQYRQDVIYFALGNPDSNDVSMVKILSDHLNLQHVRYIPLPSNEELPQLIANVVKATESYNPSIISNGLATYLLAKEAKKEGIKVVLTGEGADELFAGYHDFLSEKKLVKVRENLICDMHFTELRRLDTCTMAHSVEARCPFLDKDIKLLSDKLEHKNYYFEGKNKIILRQTFNHLLPKVIANREKISFDVGSGIRKLVVSYLIRNGETEISALKKIWKQCFSKNINNPYFYSYPTFDVAIAKRGSKHR